MVRISDQTFSSSIPTESEYAKGYELVVIDEAQKIPDARSDLKCLDNPDLMVIATGSSLLICRNCRRTSDWKKKDFDHVSCLSD